MKAKTRKLDNLNILRNQPYQEQFKILLFVPRLSLRNSLIQKHIKIPIAKKEMARFQNLKL